MLAEFDLAAVEEGVAGTRFRGHLSHFSCVASTNQLALQAASDGVRDGVWIADEQTAGRGRGGHSWHSAAGEGLYLSALVIPRIALSDAGKIPLATGLAAQAAILESSGLVADLRWPNDLMFGDKKCGGILVESASRPAGASGNEAGVRYAVIGMGINVNHGSFPQELSGLATSLCIEGGRRFAREPLLASLLRHLEDELNRLDAAHSGTAGGPELMRRFARASTWAEGKRVKVDEAGGYVGITRGLDPRGFLLVEDSAGNLRTVLSGGVRSA